MVLRTAVEEHLVLRIVVEEHLVLRIAAEARLVLGIVAEARLAHRIVAEARLALRTVAEACLAHRTVAEARLVLHIAEVVFEEDQSPVPLVSSQTRDTVRPPPAGGRSNTVSVAGGISVGRRGPQWPKGRC